MNDHVEIDHLTKCDAYSLNRDQVMDLEIWFKIHTNVKSVTEFINVLRVYMILGDTVSKLEQFVCILNHISRFIAWSLFSLKASYLVK